MKNFNRFIALLTIACFVLTQNTVVAFAADAITQNDTGAFVPVKSLDQVQAEKEFEAKPAPQPVDEFIVSPISAPTKPIDSIKPPVSSQPYPGLIENIAKNLGIDPKTIENLKVEQNFDLACTRSIPPSCRGGGDLEFSFGVRGEDGTLTQYVGSTQVAAKPGRARDTIWVYGDTHVIQTDLSLDDVQALADFMKIDSKQIIKIDSEQLATCKAMTCPSEAYALQVTLESGDTYVGGMEKYRSRDGSVHYEIKLEKQEFVKIPPAVQTHVNSLQDQVGDGFKVTAELQKDGSYLIRVVDAKIYVKAPTSGLHQMSYQLSVDGIISPKSIQATYHNSGGDVKVDGYLLFEAMGVCPQGQACTEQAITSLGRLLKMSQLIVTGVEDNAVSYIQGKTSFKTYRDRAGNVIVEIVKGPIPPAVQTHVNSLQDQVGDGFKVTAELQKDGSYLIRVVDAKVYIKAPTSGLQQMVYQLSAEGAINAQSIRAAYYSEIGGIKADAQLLFEGLHSFYSGMKAPQEVIERMILADMSKITFVGPSDSNGVFHFTLKGENYKAYRDEKGNAIIDKQLPPAVQSAVDQLVAGMQPKNFEAAIKDLGDGTFAVTLTNVGTCPKDSVCVWSGIANGDLTFMSFNISSEGKVDVATVQAAYQGVKEVDARLLFEAMGICPQGQVCTKQAVATDLGNLTKMSQITVIRSEADTVLYNQGKNSLKTYRDRAGNVIVEVMKYLIASAEPRADAGVEEAEMLVEDLIVVDSAVEDMMKKLSDQAEKNIAEANDAQAQADKKLVEVEGFRQLAVELNNKAIDLASAANNLVKQADYFEMQAQALTKRAEIEFRYGRVEVARQLQLLADDVLRKAAAAKMSSLDLFKQSADLRAKANQTVAKGSAANSESAALAKVAAEKFQLASKAQNDLKILQQLFSQLKAAESQAQEAVTQATNKQKEIEALTQSAVKLEQQIKAFLAQSQALKKQAAIYTNRAQDLIRRAELALRKNDQKLAAQLQRQAASIFRQAKEIESQSALIAKKAANLIKARENLMLQVTEAQRALIGLQQDAAKKNDFVVHQAEQLEAFLKQLNQ